MLSPPFAFRYNYTFKPVSVNLCKAFSELKKKYSEQPLPIILDLIVDYLALAECFCLFRSSEISIKVKFTKCLQLKC